MSTQGGCHAGRSCLTTSRRTRDVAGVFRCGVGPFALGGRPLAPPRLRVRALEDVGAPFAFVANNPPAGPASINLVILASDSDFIVLSVFVFRPARRAAVAFACFAASTGGSSCTSWYSNRTRAARFARSAVSFEDVGVWRSNV